MDNSTTFQGSGEVAYIPVVVNGKQERQTNADRIRSMTDEELAEAWWKWIDCGECPARPDCSMLYKDCVKYALEWLKKEYER